MKYPPSMGRRRFLRNSAACALGVYSRVRLSDKAYAEAPAVDYAESRYVDLWLRHPVFGDPSFDSFERVPGNPILTGAPPFDWPVNGFFFPDPASGHWYIYVGDYPKGYLGPPPSRCILFRSQNLGQSWENLGTVLHGDPRMFDENGHTPDVKVVFANGRYHMVYDWGLANFNQDGGLAYAWADKPEGPWHRAAAPITRNSTLTPLLGRYRRTYAPTLLRRQNDWLILAMMDHAPYSWAFFAMTAPEPQGPYSERKLIRHVEAGYFLPPLLEGYPAFVDAGWVYAPATSVARNRNFQLLVRAPLEKATDPQAWQIVRHGSVWHSEDVPNEAYGIWGQTFSGWVDRQGILRAMFPSRNAAGFGTINLAKRSWSKPLRPRGFKFSGHYAPSLTCLRQSYSDFTLAAALSLRGRARIIWDYLAPLGPDHPTSDAALHSLSLTRHQGLDLGSEGWRIVTVDAQGNLQVAAAGPHSGSAWKIVLARKNHGATSLSLEGKEVWSGSTNASAGPLGLFVEPHSYLSVDRFEVAGKVEPNTISLLHTEGWLGAGENPADWIEEQNPIFRYGIGGLRRNQGGRVKWNFLGSGFTLWSPKGPDFGTIEIRLDGTVLANVDLHSSGLQPSQPVFRRNGFADTFHAVALEPVSGRLVVDSLDVNSGSGQPMSE